MRLDTEEVPPAAAAAAAAIAIVSFLFNHIRSMSRDPSLVVGEQDIRAGHTTS